MFVVRDATQKSPKLECRAKTAWSTVVWLYVSWAAPFMKHSVKHRSAVRMCFLCIFVTVWKCCFAFVPTRKMTDVKEQRVCNKFCFKLCKTASETHSMREEAFGDSAYFKLKPTNGLSVSRNDGYQLMKKSVLDDHQLTTTENVANVWHWKHRP